MKEMKTKYCKKHNQVYYHFLNECPICVGERRGAEIERKRENGNYNVNKKGSLSTRKNLS